MGAEFVPTLEEGDLAMQMSIPPGSSHQPEHRHVNGHREDPEG
jgi:cobalt-zinc-cadmium resistance protein CzcA